jgi:hypothetical protein
MIDHGVQVIWVTIGRRIELVVVSGRSCSVPTFSDLSRRPELLCCAVLLTLAWRRPSEGMNEWYVYGELRGEGEGERGWKGEK